MIGSIAWRRLASPEQLSLLGCERLELAPVVGGSVDSDVDHLAGIRHLAQRQSRNAIFQPSLKLTGPECPYLEMVCAGF
jgi:hypothetical protein